MFFKWPCLHIGCFIPNFNSFGIQIRNILDSEKYAPWSWMVDLAIPGRTGSQAPSAPGGVFWMNQAIFWACSNFFYSEKLWEFQNLWFQNTSPVQFWSKLVHPGEWHNSLVQVCDINVNTVVKSSVLTQVRSQSSVLTVTNHSTVLTQVRGH